MSGQSAELEVALSGGVLFAARVQAGEVRDLWAQRADDPLVEGTVLLGKLSKRLPGGQGAWADIGLGQSAPLAAPGKAREGTLAPMQLLGAASAYRQGKMPPLSLDIAIPGRLLVHRPFGEGISFSRRLSDAQRRPWPKALDGLPGAWLVRAAAAEAEHNEVTREAAQLANLSGEIAKSQAGAGPGAVLLPGPAVWQRAILDCPDAATLRVEPKSLLPTVRAWAAAFAPGLTIEAAPARALTALIDDPAILLSPAIALPGGGTMWIEHTRALTAVDIDAPMNARPREVNHAAARLLARLIRLRNLGGQFAVDFLRMGRRGDADAVLQALRDGLAASPAQHHFAPAVSAIGPYLFSRERRGTPVADIIDPSEPYKDEPNKDES